MSDEKTRTRLIDEYLKRGGRVYVDRISRTQAEAERRFYCTKLTGAACPINGRDCARRHANAVNRWRVLPGTSFDGALYNTPYDRNDQTCATCDTGSARARLLGVVTKTRQRRERPKHGRALAKALTVTPASVGEMLGRDVLTTADLRARLRWSENTIKKWLVHFESEGGVERAKRVGLYVQWKIIYKD